MPFVNRYRLPFNLRRPQYQDEKEVFRKANGETVVLSSIVRKQYEGVTDYMPERLHERLKIALSHELVAVEGEKYFGSVVQDGGYEIAYPDFLDYPLAPARFNVNVTPYNASASNCGTCEEYSQVVTEDDDIGTIGEDETVIVPILYNDAICCSPFDIALVTFNSTYVDSCNIVGNTLVIHTKTNIPTQNSVILATYRVTCENGMYDEADVIANVEGSIEECLSPRNATVILITGTEATVRWLQPAPPPACDFIWNLYLASDLGTPVQSGTKPATLFLIVLLSLNGLTPATNYVIQVASDCCDGDISPFVSASFTTNPPEESEICGSYQVEFFDGCGVGGSSIDFQYLNCLDTYVDITIFHDNHPTICMKQTSPGNPIYYNVIGYNDAGGTPCSNPYELNVTYLGPC